MILKQTGKLAPADEPYRLLRDMVDDVELQEQCEDVEIDTNALLHEAAKQDSKCRQSPVGVVMSRRLGADTEHTVYPSDFPNEVNRLCALDCFRLGEISVAFRYLGIEHPTSLPKWCHHIDYNVDPLGFKLTMRTLANNIESVMKGKDKK
jgi:predicted YcjX-like family ATPase